MDSIHETIGYQDNKCYNDIPFLQTKYILQKNF